MNDKEFELAMQARLMREWKGIPAGTPVIVTRDFNKGELRTKTCSPPFLLGGSKVISHHSGVASSRKGKELVPTPPPTIIVLPYSS